MHHHIDRMIGEFEGGRLSRRDLIARLAGLGSVAGLGTLLGGAGAAFSQTTPSGSGAGGGGAAGGAAGEAGAPDAAAAPTVKAVDFQHLVMNVSDVQKSAAFYVNHLGMQVWRAAGGAGTMLRFGTHSFLALYNEQPIGARHAAYVVENFNAQAMEASLRAAGLHTDRRDNRLYTTDPDGITLQIGGVTKFDR